MKKKLTFSSCPGAKVRHQRPPWALHEHSLDQVVCIGGEGGGVGTCLYTGYTGAYTGKINICAAMKGRSIQAFLSVVGCRIQKIFW